MKIYKIYQTNYLKAHEENLSNFIRFSSLQKIPMKEQQELKLLENILKNIVTAQLYFQEKIIKL